MYYNCLVDYNLQIFGGLKQIRIMEIQNKNVIYGLRMKLLKYYERIVRGCCIYYLSLENDFVKQVKIWELQYFRGNRVFKV